MGIGEQSEEIVNGILKDLVERSHIGNAWEEVDAFTRYEIEDKWRLIVRRILERG